MNTINISKQGIIDLLKNNDRAIMRALVVLYERQTQDEQTEMETINRNGRGFRPCHAYMGSAHAQWFLKTNMMTAKQIAYWRKPMKNGQMRIEIYAGQLLMVAQQKAIKNMQA